MNEREEWLTIKEAMERLKISERTIYRWMKQGRFPHAFKLGSRLWRLPEADVEKMRNGHRQPD